MDGHQWCEAAGKRCGGFGGAGSPPFKKAAYSLEVENVFGRRFSVATKGEVTPVATRATPRVAAGVYPYEAPMQYRELGGKPRGEAPFYARLVASDIENAHRLSWTIRNDRRAVRAGERDTIFQRTVEGNLAAPVYPSHEIFTAGSYKLILCVSNTTSGCEDSVSVNIKVDSALLKTQAIPNAFSPNGDGINDVFQLIDAKQNCKSLKSFQINILDHRGKEVYKYDGDPRAWEGWE